MLDLPSNKLKVENIHSEFCKEIALICQPLRIFDINYFHYVRSYKDGSRISLSNNRPFSEHYYDKEFYLQPAVSKTHTNNKSTCRLWLSFPPSVIFQDLSNLFDIDNGITITKSFSNYTDFYYFGSSTHNKEINNFYLVKIHLLERFIAYFMDSASLLIKRAKKKRILLPVVHDIIETEQVSIPIFNNSNLMEDFVTNTPIKKFRINDGKDEIIITTRQMDCITGILNGKTAKEISRENHLSVRTVENYINAIKVKFECYKKNQLIEKLKTLSVFTNY